MTSMYRIAVYMVLQSVAAVGAGCMSGEVDGDEAADPALPSACVELDNPAWDAMRKLAGQAVVGGTLSRATAEQYNCDPRLVYEAMSYRVVTVDTPAVQPLVGGCRNSANIIVELGWPVALIAKQNLYCCYDGTTVSSWGGVCTGSTTGWGRRLAGHSTAARPTTTFPTG
jgi:hypothetical protein